MRIQLITLFLTILICSCKESNTGKETVKSKPVAISLLGTELYPRQLSPETKSTFESNLKDAEMMYKAHPQEEMSIIWYGRRLAYLDRYEEAIAVYTKGLEIHPSSYKILRHRGHKYISIRDFDRAIADLSRAAALAEGTTPETEPDGLPNRLNQPLTTTQWNIYYHLGLAYYLKGDFEKALDAYQSCYALSDNPDVLVAIIDWMYMTLRRLGRQESAEELLVHIDPEIEIIENDSYLNRILMYQGLRGPESLLTMDPSAEDNELNLATQGYGVGNWYLYNGDTARALQIFKEVVEGDYWPAFGFIAAEAELARLTDLESI